MSKTLILSVLVALSQARFNQEGLATAAVQALSDRGNPGEAGTLSGQVPGVLLGAANACDKLKLADEIVSTLGSTDDVLLAAIGVVAAEKNFNNFNQAIPTICDDATLPVTAELRGIIPLVDPGVTGSDVENANSATSKTTPFTADGLSVAGVMAAQGFSNFTAQTADGATAAPAAGANAGADAGADKANAGADAAPAVDCNGGAAQADDNNNADNAADKAGNNNADNAADKAGNNNADANQDAAAGNANAGVQKSSIAGLDFGKCVPTMDLQLGRAGRKADEATFLPTDALVAQGQQDALNPNIICNKICDQLTNVCEANQAAKDACDKAQTLVAGLGTKDQTTADAFNQALGFA